MRKAAARRASLFFAAGVAALLAALPASAVPHAPIRDAGASRIEPVEFRFPWEGRAKPKRRVQKRGVRQERAPKSTPGKKPNAQPKGGAAPAAAPVDPMDAALPPAAGPLELATPRGGTQREAEKWAAVAAQLAPPAAPPLLPAEGPAPAPPHVVAMLPPPGAPETDVPRGAATPALAVPAPAAPTPMARPALDEDDEAETPDLHVPLPPVRPRAPADANAGRPSREGLSPEGPLRPDSGLAPEGGLAPEEGVGKEPPPLPPVRPGGEEAALEPPPGPTAPAIALPVVPHEEDADCRALAAEGVADAERIPPIEGPGVCGGGPLVTLSGVKRRDGETIRIKPVATLRCSMARELAAYLRDDVAPAAEAAGAALTRLEIAGSFQCRGRNGAAGGKMSEHGRANAIDLTALDLADGRSFGVFAEEMPRAMADALKSGACARFSTVLGPGSDGFHESHLHLDLQPRRSKSKLCQWSDPEVAKAKQDEPAKDASGAKDDDPERKAAARRAEEPDKTQRGRSGTP